MKIKLSIIGISLVSLLSGCGASNFGSSQVPQEQTGSGCPANNQCDSLVTDTCLCVSNDVDDANETRTHFLALTKLAEESPSTIVNARTAFAQYMPLDKELNTLENSKVRVTGVWIIDSESNVSGRILITQGPEDLSTRIRKDLENKSTVDPSRTPPKISPDQALVWGVELTGTTTNILEYWMSSSRLMVRLIVAVPDPQTNRWTIPMPDEPLSKIKIE